MTWPAVFDGIGALFVGANNDPDVQAARIPGLTWVALKANGADASPLPEQQHWVGRMKARGLTVGSWVYCFGPPLADYNAASPNFNHLTDADAFVVYDIEKEYKTDEGAPVFWPDALVSAHRQYRPTTPAAVTSYGAIPGYDNRPSSIDFGPFVRAGWPIIAQIYDGYVYGDQMTYAVEHGGPYPATGIHGMYRRLKMSPGEAVYRPESIDS